LPGKGGVTRDVRSGSATVTIRTHELQATLDRLLAWAWEQGVTLRDLHARPASLEEAFLALAADPAGEAQSTGTA
jgi:ABC-2 type transport system ATP-binding protein